MKETTLLFTLLDKATRQTGLYGPSHPQTMTAVTEAFRRFKDVLGQIDRVQVEVNRGELIENGEVIFELEKKDRNYLQSMYEDGVRSMTFVSGLAESEIAKLCSVMARDVSTYESQEEDTVTLLWKANLNHVHCETVDVYEGDLNALLREQLLMDDLTSQDDSESNFLASFIERLISAQPDAIADKIDPESLPGADEIPKAPPALHFTRSDDEVEEVQALSHALRKQPYEIELLTILAEILEQERTPEGFSHVLTTFETSVRGFLLEGKVELAAVWISELKTVASFIGKDNQEYAALLVQSFRRLTEPSLYAEIGEKYFGKIPGRPEDWVKLLFLFKDHAAAPAIEILRSIQQETFRSSLVSFLSTHCGNRKDVFIQHLGDKDPLLVRDMARVLAATLSPSDLAEALRPLIYHDQAALRLEVIRASSKLPKATTQAILPVALRDKDAEVQRQAVLHMGKQADPHFAKLLASEIQKDDFVHVNPSEQKIFFVALVKCAQDKAYPFLAQVIRASATPTTMRVAALQSLTELKDIEIARELLFEYAGRKLLDRGVGEAAKAIIAKFNLEDIQG